MQLSASLLPHLRSDCLLAAGNTAVDPAAALLQASPEGHSPSSCKIQPRQGSAVRQHVSNPVSIISQPMVSKI
jgi:hypothetical protein